MTKTVTAAGSYRFAKLVLPVFMPVGTNTDRSFVWNFEMRLSGKPKLPKKDKYQQRLHYSTTI
jgi:hypothetical protein